MTKLYQIRCPIHGLIPMNAWERKLIDSVVFQRLRRIRQLAWTDYVYPGAMHTRFEHSIGVMYVASLLFDNIVANSIEVLADLYGGSADWIPRERQKVRLAALLHDVGHSPFSHASEELFPEKDSFGPPGTRSLFADEGQPKRRYKHEEYSIALIKGPLKDEIEANELNHGFRITADEIADLLQGGMSAGPTLLWREILSNQLDADRMDYLLRDSHHLGVSYGKYDLHRLASSVCAFRHQSTGDSQVRVRIGVFKGGLHAAESLIIARYSMFKQVYFHKTRTAYDVHLQHAMEELLPQGMFPPPDEKGLEEYLTWSDWKVQGLLADGKGGEHAERLLKRRHYRIAYASKDRLVASKPKSNAFNSLIQEEKKLTCVKAALAGLATEVRTSKNNWYKLSGDLDITVVDEFDRTKLSPLSEFSAIAEFNAQEQCIIYVNPEDIEKAKTLIGEALKKLELASTEKKTVKRKEALKKVKKRKKKEPQPILPVIQDKKSVSSAVAEAPKKEASDVG